MKHQTISLRDANQNFSRLMAAVERGETFCITRRGQEVARLVPSLHANAPTGATGNASARKLGPAAPIPAQDTSLVERLDRLEVRVDKLSVAIKPVTPKPSRT